MTTDKADNDDYLNKSLEHKWTDDQLRGIIALSKTDDIELRYNAAELLIAQTKEIHHLDFIINNSRLPASIKNKAARAKESLTASFYPAIGT